MVDSNIHVIVDNGSGFIKAGFSGESSPRFYFPTIVGHTKVEGVYVSEEKKESIIGNEAQQKFGILDINYPIQEGRIIHWDEMMKIWYHTFFTELKIAPEEHNIFLTESPFNTREDREKITEIMFETFNCPCMYLSNQSVLSAYAVGKSTGCVIDCGDGSTNFSPIFEGLLCRNGVTHIPIAGKEIFENLYKLLLNNNNIESKMEKESLKKIKEDYCYIAEDYDFEIGNCFESEVELPDKRKIKIGKEKFQACECLFNPKDYGYNCNSLQEQFMETIKLSDMDMRDPMFANILFNGGSTLFKGFKQRADKEIKDISKDYYNGKKKVHFYPEAKFMSWIGGSILTSLSNFENLWVTKSDYKEVGTGIVHRKCF